MWSTPGWLPEEIGIIIDNGQLYCYEGGDLRLHLLRSAHNITVFELVGIVADVHQSDNQASHLVSMVNGKCYISRSVCQLTVEVAISEREPQMESQWHLFNDFLVRKISPQEALRFSPSWKLPSVLTFQIKEARNRIDDSWLHNLNTEILYNDDQSTTQYHNRLPPTYRLLDPNEHPSPGTKIAIDAEFIALQREEIEIKPDGTRETVRPSRLGLARVSVLRGIGHSEGVPFIDDYIVTKEPVVDYLTAYSGIRAGDLEPSHSRRHCLIPLKVAYKKLWILLNLGCVFIGHGLPKDFRTINIHVPKDQVIDTVDLFYIKARQRKISLRFLAWYLLRQDIQTNETGEDGGGHDSIEDARTALSLWRKYEEFVDAGIVQAMLEDIYAKGRETNFKAPSQTAAEMKQIEEDAKRLGLEGSISGGGNSRPGTGYFGGPSGTGTPGGAPPIGNPFGNEATFGPPSGTGTPSGGVQHKGPWKGLPPPSSGQFGAWR
jgi:PAB-dependent poly(A)-specific ribonuclease subunit 2